MSFHHMKLVYIFETNTKHKYDTAFDWFTGKVEDKIYPKQDIIDIYLFDHHFYKCAKISEVRRR